MSKGEKWARMNYTPCLPIGDNNSKITGSKKHIELSQQAASEGIVLLKNNDDVLPLKANTCVAIFGKAQIDYVKGGGGSGDVHCDYTYNIYEGLSLSGKVIVFDRLSLYYEAYVREMYRNGAENGMFDEPEIPDELLIASRDFADTAIITINRFSSEGRDRGTEDKDVYFDLTEKEKTMISSVTKKFSKTIVLINAGAMINTEWFADNDDISAALMIWQGGMEGAIATAKVLTGEITPSGKLTDTCAKSLGDYPSSESFHENEDYVKYIEDIFVGYRYFETIPGKQERVVYPFGYGLSYTTFEMTNIAALELNGRIYVTVKITNTGVFDGKEVVQLYYSAPNGKITKPMIELCAFKKTVLLAPGESETVMLEFDVEDMASFDDTGAVEESAYILESGVYRFFIGNSVRNTIELDYKYTLQDTKVIRKLNKYCSPKRLDRRMTASGGYTTVPKIKHERKDFACGYVCEARIPASDESKRNLIDVYNGKICLDNFVAQLTDGEMIDLLKATKDKGVANTRGFGGSDKYGIPAIMTADGPAGVRIEPKTGVRTTAFPIASMLACTWNTELVEAIGRAGAREMKENNLFVWLTPALNIHRSPLCGRNFEYYSEDPYIAGKMAAALVRGIQSQGVAATPKHFACNNKETNRFESDSIVSERALREIYLRGFEICIKDARPKTIMTSYNLINGVRASENAELITGILRGEWGFDGLVMSDWDNHAEHYKEVLAGNDLRMPVLDAHELKEAFSDGKITRDQMAVSVKRVLQLILWFD